MADTTPSPRSLGSRLLGVFRRGSGGKDAQQQQQQQKQHRRTASRDGASTEAGDDFDDDAAQRQAPRRSDEEVLADARRLFFAELSPEAVVAMVVEAMPADADFAWLENAVWEHERALELVNSELSARILDSYGAFVDSMQHIHEVGVDVQQSTVVCRGGRISVRLARAALAGSALELVAKQRRQQMYKAIIGVLSSVRLVSGCVKALDAALQANDYELAISTFFKAHKLAHELLAIGGLHCVEGLQRTIDSASTMLRTRLDDALRHSCQAFVPQQYGALLNAFRLMGRSFEVLNKLDEFFTADVETRCRQVVLLFISPAAAMALDEQALSRLKMAQACADVMPDHYIDCLLNLLGVCTEIMWNFHAIKRWHDEAAASSGSSSSQKQGEGGGGGSEEDFADTRMGLERVRKKVWDSMQRQVGYLLQHASLSQYQVEDAMRVVEAINTFVSIGREFSGKSSATLLDQLKERSATYFEEVKRSMTEDLHAMLGNEQWQKVPVVIRVSDVKELRNIGSMNSKLSAKAAIQRAFFTTQQPTTPDTNPFYGAARSRVVGGGGGGSLLAAPQESVDAEEDDEDESTSEELAREFVEDDDSVDSRGEQAIVTSSAINIARKFGRYIRMMQALDAISFDIFKGIMDIYNSYLYTVWTCFVAAAPSSEGMLGNVAVGLRASKMFEGLRDRVSSEAAPRTSTDSPRTSTSPAPAAMSPSKPTSPSIATTATSVLIEPPVIDRPEGFVAPTTSARLDMNNPTNLFGLLHRIVATESLLFLRDAMLHIQPVLRSALPEERVPVLEQFYARSVNIVEDVRLFMYRNIAQHLVAVEQAAGMAEKIKWDGTSFKEDQERPYVVHIKKELGMLEMRLDGLRKQGCLPQRARVLLWESVSMHVMDVLLEGFSRIKKCSNEGRALMALDLQTVAAAVEHVSGLRPAPGISTVEAYIKAFYLTEREFLEFCRSRAEFTQKMLVNLFSCSLAGQMQRKQRAEVQATIEEASKSRPRRPLWQFHPRNTAYAQPRSPVRK